MAVGGAGHDGRMENPASQKINLDVPTEVEAGAYADFASIWHTDQTFVLDFAAMTRPPQPGTDADGSEVVAIESRVVSRVRIPASQAWELMRALEIQLTAWEKEQGQES